MKTIPTYSAAPGDSRPIARQFMADNIRLARQRGHAPKYNRSARCFEFGGGVTVSLRPEKTVKDFLGAIKAEEETIRQAKARLKNLKDSLVETYAPHKAGEIIETRRGKISVSYTTLGEGIDGAPLWEIQGFQMLKSGKSGARKDCVLKKIL